MSGVAVLCHRVVTLWLFSAVADIVYTVPMKPVVCAPAIMDGNARGGLTVSAWLTGVGIVGAEAISLLILLSLHTVEEPAILDLTRCLYTVPHPLASLLTVHAH